MPIKVELSDEVRLFLDNACLPEEREEFVVCARLVADDPIEHSQAYLGRTSAPHVLRFFRFGGCIALFAYEWTGDEKTERIRIVACRRTRPRTRE